MKAFLFILVLLNAASVCAQPWDTALMQDSTADTSHLARQEAHFNVSDSLLHYAEAFIGVPYRYAGKSPRGFDCAGFTHFVFKHFGLHLPYSSITQFQKFEAIKKEEAQRGDLIFFKGRSSTGPGHVGIVAKQDKDVIVFIHASVNRGICYERSDSPYYRTRFISVKRPFMEGLSGTQCQD